MMMISTAGRMVPALASLSAFSLPEMPMWLGSHTSIICPLVVLRRSRVSAYSAGQLFARLEMKVSAVDKESVNTANLVCWVVFSSIRIFSTASLTAVISPVYTDTPSVSRASKAYSGVVWVDCMKHPIPTRPDLVFDASVYICTILFRLEIRQGIRNKWLVFISTSWDPRKFWGCFESWNNWGITLWRKCIEQAGCGLQYRLEKISWQCSLWSNKLGILPTYREFV